MVRDIKANEKKAAEQKRLPNGKKKKNRKKAALTVLTIVAVLSVATVFGGLYVGGLKTVYPNVSVGGVELGRLSPEEAADALIKAGYNIYQDAAVTVSLPMGYSLSVTAKEAGLELSASSAAVRAYRYGREGGFIGNLLSYLKCAVVGVDLQDAKENGRLPNEEAVLASIREVVQQVEAALMGSELTIGEDSITVVKGAKSMKIDENEILELVVQAFAEQNWSVIEYRPEISSDEELDLQGLYDAVYCEPVNAEYDPENGTATQDKKGLSFDMDEAKILWDSADHGDIVVIPLIVKEPEITTEYLNSVLFRDLLGQKSTTLAGSSAARINNIAKAAQTINGTVLNPGEEFSYNDVVGPRTAANGYLPAGAYSGGQVVTEYGGGICQVSSTIYYCALLANLEITDRTCHYFPVNYLPAGLDATVSWGGPEFKFVNSRDYPIKLEAYTDMSAYALVVKIWGTNLDGSYVQLTTETWPTADGYGAQSYRWVYDASGNLISKKAEARSVYHYHVEETESPSPSPSDSPSPSPSAPPSPSDSPSASPSPPATASAPPTETPVHTPGATSPAPSEPVETETPPTPSAPVGTETAPPPETPAAPHESEPAA